MHTPGPWHEEKCDRDGEAGRMIVRDGRCLASVSNLTGNAGANARLIAAAPDMLEALRDACDLLDKLPAPGHWADAAERVASAGRAVLAKAEGRTP